MSRILELQDSLRDTSAAIVVLERALSRDPSSDSIIRSMKSVEKRYKRLEVDFLAEAKNAEVTVCKYRLFSDDKRPTLKVISEALGTFQDLFSTVYKAIKTGPIQKAPSRKDIDKESEFGFAYTYSGSVGVVLTLPDELLLFGESRLDETMAAFVDLARVQETSQIAAFSKKLGLAPVRQMYQWAAEHTESGYGAEIEWLKKKEIKNKLFIQAPEIRSLKELMEKTGEETIKEIVVEGELLGADVLGHRFHMRVEGGEIRGVFADAISEKHTVELPKQYRAKIRKTTRVKYSTDEEQEIYFLIQLTKIP